MLLIAVRPLLEEKLYGSQQSPFYRAVAVRAIYRRGA
jgi:hypothetical protein